ncbi:hypothetical protein M9H77_13912 [Catharanthus roseus]|uniref:Uncharacterized protein n=1 Tax=Catharanthus roseus TaxID=4058 RepID=A0ACC0BLP3_CATRO|nr:hypothetical protein M9H77_13912 [Catharanthus roseus]
MVRPSGRRGDDDLGPVMDMTGRVEGCIVTASSRGVRGRHSTSDLPATPTPLASGFYHGTGELRSSTQPPAFIGQSGQIGVEFFDQILGTAPQDSSCSTHGYSHTEYGVSSSVPYIPRPVYKVYEGDMGFEFRGLARSKKESDPYILRERRMREMMMMEQPVPVAPVTPACGSDSRPYHGKGKGLTGSFMSMMNKIVGSRNKRPDVVLEVPPPTQKRKKVKASYWEQTGPAEGGPVDPELIPSYGRHDDLGLALTSGLGFNAAELHIVATSRQTSLSHRVRAACYLQYILGSSLFSDKSGNIVLALWPLLQDVSSVGRFALGAAFLVHLYGNLGQASRVDAKELAGAGHY